jgi:hypothetical protein
LCKYDAEKNILISRHEILATGCIQAPPKASSLFDRVADRAAFHFNPEAVFFFADGEVFCPGVEATLGFDVEYFGSAWVEGALTEAAAAVCDLLFDRGDLLRTRILGASFTGSAIASDLPGFKPFDDR